MLYGYKFSPRSLTRRGLSVVYSLLLASAGALFNRVCQAIIDGVQYAKSNILQAMCPAVGPIIEYDSRGPCGDGNPLQPRG